LKFLIDNQLPIALARWFTKQGVEAKHVLDVQLDGEKDSLIWQYAITHGFVLISKDEDFSDWVNVRHPVAPVIWVRIGNCRNEVLIGAFEKVFSTIKERLTNGELLIEIY
jgi:predicted nuclease of predicted toxin-antitoxin system